MLLTLPVGELGTNCFLISARDGETAVIDPGSQPELISAALEQHNLAPKMILLTHGHFDHIGAVQALKERYRLPVYVHEADAEMLSSPEKNGGISLMGRTISAPWDETVREGSRIQLGDLCFRVLHTPGHSAGSGCYETEDLLFSGDTLFCGGVGRTDLYGGSYPQLRASLKRLAELAGDRRVYPGHGPATSLEKERRQNPYLGNFDYDDLF